jgi:hypothetical protein
VRDHTPENGKGAAANGTQFISKNTQPNKTIAIEPISQEVVGYLQRRFGLLPATAIVVAELAGYPR